MSGTDRSGWHLWAGEVVAAAGLVALFLALVRTGRGAWAAPAVGAYIGAAYWFTSSTSFANPAVSVGQISSDTFARIAPSCLPGFVVAQLVGSASSWHARCTRTSPRPPTSSCRCSARPRDFDPGEMPSMTDKPSVLFACVANSGRSVTARVLAAYYGGDAVEAVSAGSEPGERIHPEVADVLTGLGLDVSQETPKGFDPDGTYAAVVTMGCGDQCPYYSGARYEDWPLDDPKGQDEATVRRIVADIDGRVRRLLAELAPDHDLPPSVLEQTPGSGSATTGR